MSLLNAWIAPDAAVIAVDTVGMAADGSPLHASKLVVVPHLGAAIALRGQLALLTWLAVRANSAGFATFDDLLDAMPGMLAEAAIGDHLNVLAGSMEGHELLVAGWSDRQGRMIGRQYVKRGDMTASIERDVDHHISPWHPSMDGLPLDPGGLEQLGRGQVIFMRGLGAHCGGKLTITRLTRGAMTLQTTEEEI
jgi:hypothetical protein